MLVARDAARFWVKLRLAIHEKQVVMMPVRKLQAGHPSPVRHPIHWCGGGVPMIEISHQENVTCFRRFTEKVHVMETPARRQARCPGVRGSLRNHRIHRFGLWHLEVMLVCGRVSNSNTGQERLQFGENRFLAGRPDDSNTHLPVDKAEQGWDGHPH